MLPRLDLLKLEALLRYFQVTCEPAVAAMAPMTRAALVANVSTVAAETLVTSKSDANTCQDLLNATLRYFNEVKAHAASQEPPVEVPKAEDKWIDFSAVAEKAPKAKAPQSRKQSLPEEPRLMPKVIKYDDAGVPLSEQEQRTQAEKAASFTVIPWEEWLTSAAARDLDAEPADMAAITLVLRSLHCKGQVETQPVEVLLDLQSKQKAVKATRDLSQGTLEIPPCAPRSGKIWATSTHPNRVTIKVRSSGPETGPTRAYYVHPEYKLPEDATTEEMSAVADDTRLWSWKGDETLHPFWAVRRLSRDDKQKTASTTFNTETAEKDFNVVTVGQIGEDSISITLTVTVPMLTNSVALKKGDELFMETTAKMAAKRKITTWKEESAAHAKAKAKPQAKPKAKSSNALAIVEV